jgi:integrase
LAKQLTAAAVQRLRPGKERREIPDGGCPGLYLIVQSSGARSWALRFRRPNGKPAKLTLGPVDLTGNEVDGEPVIGAPLTLASARRLASELHHQRARGRDLVAARRRERLEREARGAKNFAQAATDFVEQHAMRRTRRWRDRVRLLGLRPAAEGKGLELIPKGLVDRWRERPITEIDGDDIHLIVNEARERGVPGLERRAARPSESQARTMFATLSKLFGWLVEQRRSRSNPCAGVHRPATLKARDRVLTDAEQVAFWKATDAERNEFGALLKLLLITGCRLNEVAQMRRAELSGDRGTWTIPGKRTKNNRTHVVPLPSIARALIASVPTEGDLVFTTDGHHPVSGWSKIKNRLDAAMQIPPWRLHDLRRTCATGMAELGIAPHIVEAVLNHVSGARAGVAGTYNRAAYAGEKRAALERWAAHVEGLIKERPTKVVPLHHRAEA